MAEVSVHEARNNLSRLIKRAQDGEETIITSHGRPVARLVPAQSRLTGQELADWLRHERMGRATTRSRAQIDAALAAERDSWT